MFVFVATTNGHQMRSRGRGCSGPPETLQWFKQLREMKWLPWGRSQGQKVTAAHCSSTQDSCPVSWHRVTSLVRPHDFHCRPLPSLHNGMCARPRLPGACLPRQIFMSSFSYWGWGGWSLPFRASVPPAVRNTSCPSHSTITEGRCGGIRGGRRRGGGGEDSCRESRNLI